MINLPAIIVANVATFFLMLILVINQRRVTRSGLLDDKIYFVMVFLTMVQSIVEMASFIVDGKPGNIFYILGIGTNILLFSINITFAFVWTLYAEYKVFEDRERLKNRAKYLAIPAIISLCLCALNSVTPVFFSISKDNVYKREPLFAISYIVTYAYLLYGMILIYRYRNSAKKYLFLPVMTFMLPILLASIVQFLVYGISVVWLGTAIGMISLYVNVQNEVSYTDSLSGLYTREYLNNYLNIENKKTNVNYKLAGIMLDVDEFKKINDNYGHLVGDDAIISSGRIIKKSLDTYDVAARYAGDEFIVVKQIKSESDIFKLKERIIKNADIFNKTRNKEYNLNFSIGCSMLKDEDSVDDFLNRMDMNMYQEKKDKIERKIMLDRRKR